MHGCSLRCRDCPSTGRTKATRRLALRLRSFAKSSFAKSLDAEPDRTRTPRYRADAWAGARRRVFSRGIAPVSPVFWKRCSGSDFGHSGHAVTFSREYPPQTGTRATGAGDKRATGSVRPGKTLEYDVHDVHTDVLSPDGIDRVTPQGRGPALGPGPVLGDARSRGSSCWRGGPCVAARSLPRGFIHPW